MKGIPPDPAELPAAWRPPAELRVETWRDATLLPLVSLPIGAAPVRLRMGIFDAVGKPITAALHRRGRHAAEALPAAPPEQDWPEACVFGGVLWDHFGHFLVESLSRAWAFAATDGPILWVRRSGRTELLGWQRDILALIGLGGREHRIIERPTRVGRLSVPEQGLIMWRYMHPRQIDCLAAHAFRAPVTGRRVWLSRSALPPKHARVEGEAAIEAQLVAEGWTILHPEAVSVAEQLAALEAAEIIAGFAGSAFHGLMLGRQVQGRIVIFSRHPKVEGNYELIAAAKGLDQCMLRPDYDSVEGEGVGTRAVVSRPETIIEALRAAAPEARGMIAS